MADPARYRALAQAMLDRAKDDNARKSAEKCLEIAHIYDLYEQAMRDRGSVDFGDLIMRPALLLESDPSLRIALGLRHRHVLVDEYQDVNRASARLLKAISGDGDCLWVVGDRGSRSIGFVAHRPRTWQRSPVTITARSPINYRLITDRRSRSSTLSLPSLRTWAHRLACYR